MLQYATHFFSSLFSFRSINNITIKSRRSWKTVWRIVRTVWKTSTIQAVGKKFEVSCKLVTSSNFVLWEIFNNATRSRAKYTLHILFYLTFLINFLLLKGSGYIKFYRKFSMLLRMVTLNPFKCQGLKINVYFKNVLWLKECRKSFQYFYLQLKIYVYMFRYV